MRGGSKDVGRMGWRLIIAALLVLCTAAPAAAATAQLRNGVLRFEGVITAATSDLVVQRISDALADPRLKVLELRLNSEGGNLSAALRIAEHSRRRAGSFPCARRCRPAQCAIPPAP